MHTVKFILIFLILLVSGSIVAVAQNKVVIVPMQGDTASPDDTVLMAIVIPAPEEPAVESPYLVDAIDKPIVWNQGWDTSIGHNTVIDTSVQISFNGFTTAFGSYPAIAWTPNASILHWGEQTLLDHPDPRIYAKAVLLIDRGTTVEGGVFEWVVDNQNFVIDHNMFDPTTGGWLTNWYHNGPRPGDKVWFFIMSDDERFSSNPVSFIWP